MTPLYLHIGTHRTATSSLQAFVLANKEAMLAQSSQPQESAALMHDYVAEMVRAMIRQHDDEPTKS